VNHPNWVVSCHSSSPAPVIRARESGSLVGTVAMAPMVGIFLGNIGEGLAKTGKRHFKARGITRDADSTKATRLNTDGSERTFL